MFKEGLTMFKKSAMLSVCFFVVFVSWQWLLHPVIKWESITYASIFIFLFSLFFEWAGKRNQANEEKSSENNQ